MSRKSKIIWTLTEESDFYAAFISELQHRKMTFPVDNSRLGDIMKAARDAVKVIKVERRRDITSVDSIRGEIAKRLIDNGFFPRNYMVSLRRGYRAGDQEGEPDPKDIRIADLMNQIEAADRDLAEYKLTVQNLRDRMQLMSEQPTPVQLIEDFFARIIAKGLGMKAASEKPAHAIISNVKKEELPEFERERRKDPTGYIAPTANGKPKFALVADFVGSDKASIHEAVSDVAELRYIDAQAKLQGLKDFNANGGRIITWADHMPHQWDRSLTALGVTYSKHHGSLPKFIDLIKAKAATK